MAAASSRRAFPRPTGRVLFFCAGVLLVGGEASCSPAGDDLGAEAAEQAALGTPVCVCEMRLNGPDPGCTIPPAPETMMPDFVERHDDHAYGQNVLVVIDDLVSTTGRGFCAEVSIKKWVRNLRLRSCGPRVDEQKIQGALVTKWKRTALRVLDDLYPQFAQFFQNSLVDRDSLGTYLAARCGGSNDEMFCRNLGQNEEVPVGEEEDLDP